MSGGIGAAVAEGWLDQEFGGVDYPAPATHYVTLFLTMPDASGAGAVECSAGNYARLPVTNNGTNWTAAAGRTKTNAAKFEWAAAATADWAPESGKALGWGIYSAASGGVPRAWSTFVTPKAVLAGDVPFIPAGVISIGLPAT